jgi:hypothetical protein
VGIDLLRGKLNVIALNLHNKFVMNMVGTCVDPRDPKISFDNELPAR